MSRYRVASQIGDQSVEEAWTESKERIVRSSMEACRMSRLRSGRCRIACGLKWYKMQLYRAKKTTHK